MLARVDPSDEYITSIHMALRSANEFMRGLYSHGLWLRRHEALRLVEHGFQFVANYVQAAYEALFHSRTRFKLAPKLHAFLHILGYICDALAKSTDWVENPITSKIRLDRILTIILFRVLVYLIDYISYF